MCHLVYKALYEDYDYEIAQQCSEEDWITDARGADFMSRTVFYDSWFELAGVMGSRAIYVRLGAGIETLTLTLPQPYP